MSTVEGLDKDDFLMERCGGGTNINYFRAI